MNILLVFPKVEYTHVESKKGKELLNKIMGEAVSLTLPQVAAATPKEYHVTIIDENYEKLNFNDDIDLVGITCLTMAATRAYEIADEFRSRGVPVILGGNHPTALPEEAKKHANSVVIGEAEITWPLLLKDFEKGQLKAFYTTKQKFSPELIPEPRRDLINRKIFADGLLIKRGCPNRCEFCTISSLYSQGVRPLKNVIREINNISSKNIFIYDSNLTWHMKYNRQLFEELKQFNKRWQANGTINILGKNDEFLELAKEIDLFNWFIGFESVSQKSLNCINKKHNKVEDFGTVVKKVKSYGMVIVGSFIFGFDEDTPDIFDATLKAVNDWEIEMAEFHILINTLETTKNLYISYYVLQRNLRYRERYKNQFNF